MLYNNIFMGRKNKIKTILSLLLIINIIIYCILGLCGNSEVQAAQSKEKVTSKLNSYPGYSALLNKLKRSHPKWNFKILYTGLDWNQVIINESTGWHKRNLISADKTGEWVCPICGDTRYDNGGWKCASEATVSYYMDPRNFLNDDDIFQFEQSVFNSSIHTVDGVMTATAGSFLEGRENAESIIKACKAENVSPYQIIARVLQEQGKSGTVLSNGYDGYYNLFNINASGDSVSTIIANAVAYAKESGWDTQEKSIIGGIQEIKSQYIGRGQDTLYLQKFDVENSDGSLYYHQYMQNVSAAKTESYTVKNIYKDTGSFDKAITFLIPVYENMPQDACPIPGTQGIVTQNVEVNADKVNVRSAKNTKSNVIAELNKGDKILRIEIGNVEENGYKWDKVVLSDGKKGYVVSQYLTRINDITNCNESVIVNTSVNLRNGPGTNGTSIITTLVQGQVLTKIETGKYNGIDGYNWDRVKLSDGTRQGYLVSEYIGVPVETTDNGEKTKTNELVKVLCDVGLKLKEKPGLSANVLTVLDYNEIVTRVERNSEDKDGYIWDKVVTGTGLTGYVARGDSTEQYIELVKQNTQQNNNNDNNNYKVDTKNNQIITEPNTTAAKIKEKYSNAVIKKDGKVVSDKDLISTGCIITINKKDYTVIKKGDSSGDGLIDSSDLLKVQKHLLKSKMLKNEYLSAADTNSDGSIDSSDLLKIQKYLLKGTKISV